MMRLVVILFAVQFCFQTAYSQSAADKIVSVAKRVSSLSNYNLKLKYQLYVDNDFSKPFQSRDVLIQRKNTSVRISHNYGLEVLDNDNYQIAVNQKTKVFSVMKKNPEENLYANKSALLAELNTALDSVTAKLGTVKIISETSEIIKFEIDYGPESPVKKSEITVNKKNNIYQKLVIHYRAPVKLKQLDGKQHTLTLCIDYSEFKENVNYDTNVFDEKKFITVQNGKILPLKKYSDYKFIIPSQESL